MYSFAFCFTCARVAWSPCSFSKVMYRFKKNFIFFDDRLRVVTTSNNFLEKNKNMSDKNKKEIKIRVCHT